MDWPRHKLFGGSAFLLLDTEPESVAASVDKLSAGIPGSSLEGSRMDTPELWVVVVGLSGALIWTLSLVTRYKRKLDAEQFRSRSLSTKYGKITEQFLPVLGDYPWDPGNFRFLGSPIDGVQFEQDRVIFVEFKSGNSQLSRNQRRIRALVENSQVSFEVLRLG